MTSRTSCEVSSGVSPLTTRIRAASGLIALSPTRTASPVPSGCGWITTVEGSPSAGRTCSASSPRTTTKSAMPAPRSASITRRSMGTPPTEWSTLGRVERIRTPRPAASTIAAGRGSRKGVCRSIPRARRPPTDAPDGPGGASERRPTKRGCGARIRTWERGSKVPCDTASPLRNAG